MIALELTRLSSSSKLKCVATPAVYPLLPPPTTPGQNKWNVVTRMQFVELYASSGLHGSARSDLASRALEFDHR
jgi:hypothetical protein